MLQNGSFKIKSFPKNIEKRMPSSLSPFINLQLGRCCFVRSLLSRISDSNARSSSIDVDDVSSKSDWSTLCRLSALIFFGQICEIENVAA